MAKTALWISRLHLPADTVAAQPWLALKKEVWTNAAVSLLASTAETFLLFALLWVAEPQGWSGARTALMVLAIRLPALIGGPLGGKAVDRFGPRSVVLGDTLSRCVVFVGLAAAGWSGHLPFAAVLIAGAITGGLGPATYSATRANVPMILNEPAAGARANALLGASDQLSIVAGAGLVGPLLGSLGLGPSLLVPAGMLLLSAALSRGLVSRHSSSGDPSIELLAAPENGKANRSAVVTVIGLSTAYFLAYGPFETVMPVLVRHQLNSGGSVYSGLWLLFGLGALATLPFGPRLAQKRPGVVNAVGAVIWGLAMLPITLVHDPMLARIIFFVGGAIWGPYTTVEVTAIQRWVPVSRLGTIFGIQRSLLLSAAPLGAAVGALSLEYATPATVLRISALGCSMAGLAALTVKSLRQAH